MWWVSGIRAVDRQIDMNLKYYWFLLYIGPYLVITVPADGLAPNGARPSAGTVLITKWYMILSKYFQLSIAFSLIKWYHLGIDDKISWDFKILQELFGSIWLRWRHYLLLSSQCLLRNPNRFERVFLFCFLRWNRLGHWGIVATYNIEFFGQHRFKKWLVPWWYQVIGSICLSINTANHTYRLSQVSWKVDVWKIMLSCSLLTYDL